MRNVFFAALLAAGIVAPASAQVTTNVGPGAGIGPSSVYTTPSTPPRGQSFTSPGGALYRFSFSPQYIIGGGGTYTFYIAELNGNTIGTSLFSQAMPIVNGSSFTFSGFYIPTEAGQRYVAFLTPFGASPSGTEFALYNSGSNPYLSGDFVTGDATNSALAGQNANVNNGFDLMFSASFDTPEPSSWAMMIGGFALAGGALRLRRRRPASVRRSA